MPRIIFDTDKTIDLKIGQESLILQSQHFDTVNYSSSGIYEAVGQYGIDNFQLDILFQQATYRQLYDFWWYWARHRYAFALAMNTSKMVNTTLDGAAAADQKVIPVTSTTGLVAGDEVIIESATTEGRELRSIASVSTGVSITVDENLFIAFASGDSVRHANYYPSLICTDESFKPLRSGDWYSHTFMMIEARTA
jgi:hypothetical protein